MDMPLTCADVVVLTADERVLLTCRANVASGPHRDVVRARSVLAAADGQTNAQIDRELRICEDTARRWRHRFWGRRVDGLKDRPRPGRPPAFTPVEA